jgi:hypothetical protein
MKEVTTMKKMFWQMTIKQYTKYQIEISEYRDAMKEMPDVYNESHYYDEWMEILQAAAIDNVIPEVVLRSLVNYAGETDGKRIITGVFRGRLEKGAKAYWEAQKNKQPKTIYIRRRTAN